MLKNISLNYNLLILLMIIICLIGVILIFIALLQKKKATSPNLEEKVLSPEQEELKKEIFNIYKKVEVAKSKFDYETLKELLTDTLYKVEEQKLKELKKNKQKRIATNIKLQELKILSTEKQEKKELIKIYLYVSRYDYVIDNKKNIIRGTDDTEYQVEYKITLEKNNNKYFKIKEKECTGKWIKNI